jgi:predicted membrane-bound mannosyltransferase
MIDSALDTLLLLGAGIVFLVTLENRRKRNRVIHAVNRLRCIAHIVDMHQLTKDPDSIAEHTVSTPHSPQRVLTQYELARYLDYCTEMLSLVSKTAFLYVQDYHDPVATEAVNDLEDLTSGLSSKMWQKIMMLPTQQSDDPAPIQP